MAEEIKVSVIIPVYNGAKYIKRAIDSALNQDVDLEVLVIDDQSTDALPQVMQEYEETDCVHWIQNEVNLGVAKSRNHGVKLAKGEYIAFLDADDWWEPGKLTKQLTLMRESGAVISSTARELMTPDGQSTNRIIEIPERVTYQELLKHNCLSCSSVVVEKAVIQQYPMEHDDSHEDYITWLKIAKEHGWVLGVNYPYLKYRLSEGGKSRNKLKSACMTWKAYRYAGLSIFATMKYMVSYTIHGFKKYYG